MLFFVRVTYDNTCRAWAYGFACTAQTRELANLLSNIGHLVCNLTNRRGSRCVTDLLKSDHPACLVHCWALCVKSSDGMSPAPLFSSLVHSCLSRRCDTPCLQPELRTCGVFCDPEPHKAQESLSSERRRVYTAAVLWERLVIQPAHRTRSIVGPKHLTF